MVEELERLWRLAHPYILADMMSPDSRRARIAEHDVLIDRLRDQDRAGVVEALARHRTRSRPVAVRSPRAAPAGPGSHRARRAGRRVRDRPGGRRSGRSDQKV
jgi:DNA-binding GntR family transcriptional regulator